MNNENDYADLKDAILSTINEKNPQTVKELSTLVQNQVSLSEEEILDAIQRLQSEEKIHLSSPIPPNFSYLKSKQALWFWATVAIAVLTVIFTLVINEDFYPWSYPWSYYLRNTLGVIFVLWLPGYCFIKAFFPTHISIKEPSENLGIAEQIGLSIIMSLALVALMGLILNFTPWGIRLIPIILSLLTLTLTFATAAVIRVYYSQGTLR